MREGWAGTRRMRNRGVDRQAKGGLHSSHSPEGHRAVQSHPHVGLMSCDSMIMRAVKCKVSQTAWSVY